MDRPERLSVCTDNGLWIRLFLLPTPVCTRRWRGNGHGRQARGRRAGRPPRDRKSSPDSDVDICRNQSPVKEAGLSSGASGKSENQHNVRKGEDKQAVGQGNMSEQPKLERELKRIVIVQAVLLPNQAGQFIKGGSLGVIDIAIEVPDFA